MLLRKTSIVGCGSRSVGTPLAVAPVAKCAVESHLVKKRKACTVSAAAHTRDQQQQGDTDGVASRKPSAMPRLPDIPAKQRSSSPPKSDNVSSSSSSSSSNSSSRPSPKPRRPLPPSLPPEQQQQAQERTLAGLLAYSGLLGTVATITSVVAPDVDLFGGFQLVPADIILGLQLLLPCCLLNLAIMLPDYSSWKVPEEPTLEAQQKMAEALLAWTANKKAAADAASKPAAMDAAAAAGDPNSAVSRSSAASQISDSSSGSSSGSGVGHEADQKADSLAQPAASSSSSSGSVGAQARPLPPGVSPPWMVNNPDPPLPLPLARCKDALLMAQGHYLSSTPRVALPWPMQVGVLLVNCMAAELLYRSVALQVLGGWLTDRTLEAGAEDWFLAAAAHLPVLPTPHSTGQLTAVALLSAAWGAAVVQQVLRMSRRPSMAMASQGRAAAGKLMQDMQRLAAGPPKDHQQQQQGEQEQQVPAQQQQQQPGGSSRHLAGGAEGRAGPSSSPAAPGAATASTSKEAAKLALAAAAAADQAGPGPAGSSRPSRQGLAGGLPNTLGALALSQAVTGVRDLSQFAGLGLAFALTGNLAAPFVAAVVADGIMAVLQRRGQERSRQRSIAFAKHFASFTRVLRDVQRQQTLKQEQLAPGSQQQQAAVPPAASPSSTHDDGAAAMPLACTSSLSTGSAGDDDALDAAVTAAVVPGAAALHAAAAAGEEAAGAAAGGPAGGSSRMESTISLLDQLVVEQLAEHAAAAGPHK